MNRNLRVQIFSSFAMENKAEYQRRAKMSPEERVREFSALQDRAWGEGWGVKPIQKIATWETVDWLDENDVQH